MMIACSSLTVACSFAPKYKVSETPPPPPAYLEATGWTQARPADSFTRDAWWSLFGDARSVLEQAQFLHQFVALQLILPAEGIGEGALLKIAVLVAGGGSRTAGSDRPENAI